MANHESNGHTDDHGHDNTEGNRQYYPKGWWIPLVGLVIIAFGFTALGTFAFSISGTDRWGKTEQCCENGDGACCKDGDKDACKGDKDMCKDGDKDKANCNMDMNMAGNKMDSMHMMDSMKPADHH